MWLWMALALGSPIDRCATSKHCPVTDVTTTSEAIPHLVNPFRVAVLADGSAVAAWAGLWLSAGAEIPEHSGLLATDPSGVLHVAARDGLYRWTDTWTEVPSPWPADRGSVELSVLVPLDAGGWGLLGGATKGATTAALSGWWTPNGGWVDGEHPGHLFGYSTGSTAPWWVRIGHPDDSSVQLALFQGEDPGPELTVPPGFRRLATLGEDGLLIRRDDRIRRVPAGGPEIEVGPESIPNPTPGASWTGRYAPPSAMSSVRRGSDVYIAALQHTGTYEADTCTIDPCASGGLDCYMIAPSPQPCWTGEGRTELVLWHWSAESAREVLRVAHDGFDALALDVRGQTAAIALFHSGELVEADPETHEPARLDLVRVDLGQ